MRPSATLRIPLSRPTRLIDCGPLSPDVLVAVGSRHESVTTQAAGKAGPQPANALNGGNNRPLVHRNTSHVVPVAGATSSLLPWPAHTLPLTTGCTNPSRSQPCAPARVSVSLATTRLREQPPTPPGTCQSIHVDVGRQPFVGGISQYAYAPLSHAPCDLLRNDPTLRTREAEEEKGIWASSCQVAGTRLVDGPGSIERAVNPGQGWPGSLETTS